MGPLRPRAARPIRLKRMPAWVAKSPVDAVERTCGLAPHPHITAPLRCNFVQNLTLPPAVNPLNRFRRNLRELPGRGRLSRCQIPTHIPLTVQDIDDVIVGLTAFLQTLMAEEDSMFGVVGSNAAMRKLVDAMSQCFDWERLVFARATADDVRAFATVADLLAPYMLTAHWPSQHNHKLRPVSTGFNSMAPSTCHEVL